MENLFDKESVEALKIRLEKLSGSAERQWGTMEPAQMLAHCSEALEMARGINKPPRLFIGRILTLFMKSVFYNEKPFGRNSPTDKSLIVSDSKDLDKEKERLLDLIDKFHQGGPENCTSHPHCLFGNLTPEQWAVGMYKHLDHHFRQFNI